MVLKEKVLIKGDKGKMSGKNFYTQGIPFSLISL